MGKFTVKKKKKAKYVPSKRQVKYTEYRDSKHWKKTRGLILKLKGRKCEACGSVNKIHVHHNNYENIGKETAEDLNILCGTCHSEFHKIHGSKIYREQTLNFIKTFH